MSLEGSEKEYAEVEAMGMNDRRIKPKAVAAILQQLLPCLDPEKVINTFGERTVIYSDDTEAPELNVRSCSWKTRRSRST